MSKPRDGDNSPIEWSSPHVILIRVRLAPEGQEALKSLYYAIGLSQSQFADRAPDAPGLDSVALIEAVRIYTAAAQQIEVEYGNTATEKLRLLRQRRDADLFYAGWPGKTRQDLFVLKDPRNALYWLERQLGPDPKSKAFV